VLPQEWDAIIRKAQREDPEALDAFVLARSTLSEVVGEKIDRWNDRPDVTLDDVLEAFDRAILALSY
jgi:hypothetical protein